MADNVAITAGSGTTVATDEIAGVNHQRVKVSLGADGTANDAEAGAGAVNNGTQRVTLASDDPAVAALETIDNAISGSEMQTDIVSAPLLDNLDAGEYETVAASQTDQALGATGASGDFLSGVLIVPGAAAAGAVSIKDGAGSAIQIFAGGGTVALPTLAPFFVPLGIKSTGGAWSITTGANVTAIGVGNFT